MPVTPYHVLELAEQLAQRDSENAWRASAAAAYYAAYHHALLLGDKKLPACRRAMGVHASLIERFKMCGVGGKAVGYRLASLKKTRVRADYQLHASFQRSVAQSQLDATLDVMSETERFLSDLAPQSSVG